MPFFVVILQGEDICLPVLPGAENDAAPEDALDAACETITGFYTTRRIRAANASDAVVKAKAVVLDEWQTEKYASINQGSLPSLTEDTVYSIPIWEFMFPRFPTRGYTFYAGDKKAL